MKSEVSKQSNLPDRKEANLSPHKQQAPTHSISRNIMQLQKSIGNQGVMQLFSQPGISNDKLIQRRSFKKLSVAQMAFADAGKKTGHFTKHGSEFGSADEDTYETAAETFTAKADAGTKQSKAKSNGDVVHFDSATDEFSVVTSGGVHRTYFKPDPAIHGLADNQAYFDSQ